MKILFLTDNFPPEVNAPANRTYEHCREWVEQGVDVTVITCAPNFPKGIVYPGYKNKLYQLEYIDGIKVVRVWSYISANEGTFKRTLDFISFAFSSFFAGLFIKTDLIIATSPQFFTAISGFMLSIFKRRKWVFEVRDLWPESIVAVGAMKRNFIIRFFEGVEKFLYAKANHIIPVTDTFKERIILKGINPNKISVFKNGSNLELFKPHQKDEDLLRSLSLEGKLIVGYIGTHGMSHGLDFILRSIVELKESKRNLHFVFIGDGAEKKKLVSLAKHLALTNITFVDSVGKKDVVKYLNILDVALVNLISSDTFRTVIPSKIFESAAMLKPILLGLEGETKELILSYSAGICFIPENKESFIYAVDKICAAFHDNSIQNYRAGCFKLANDFDRKKIANRLLNVLKKV